MTNMDGRDTLRRIVTYWNGYMWKVTELKWARGLARMS